MQEQVKKKLGTEEEPFEGEVPVAKVEDEIVSLINADKKAKLKITYVFDGHIHSSINQYTDFLQYRLGTPSAILPCQCEKSAIVARYKKKNEVEDISEEV